MPLEIQFNNNNIWWFLLIILHSCSFLLFFQLFSGSLLFIFICLNGLSLFLGWRANTANQLIRKVQIFPNHRICVHRKNEEIVEVIDFFACRYLIVIDWQGEYKYRQFIFPWMCSRDNFRKLLIFLSHFPRL